MLKFFYKTIIATLFALSAFNVWADTDLNAATATELAKVKGIGPATAERIIQEREKEAFSSWQDFITRITGIAEKKAVTMSDAGLRIHGKAFELNAPAKP